MAARKKTRKAAKKKTTKRSSKSARKTSRKKTTRKPAKKKKAARKTSKKSPARRKPAKKKAKKKSKRKPNAAFMKPMQPDDVLGAVVGNKAIPRTEVTKKVWAYIKRRGLQDKKNRRMINADDKLKKVFNGKKQVDMFSMTKLVNSHLG